MALGLGISEVAAVSSATSVTTAGVTTTTGSTIAVFGVWSAARNFSSITDSKSNTWTQIETEFTTTVGELSDSRLYYNDSGTRGTSHTFTLTTATSGANSIGVIEITGTDTSSLDQSGRQEDTASPFVSTSETTTVADEALLAFTVSDSIVASTNNTFGNSFTLLDEVTDGSLYWVFGTAYRIVTATGTYNSTVTIDVAVSSTACWISTHKVAAGGVTPYVPWLQLAPLLAQ